MNDYLKEVFQACYDDYPYWEETIIDLICRSKKNYEDFFSLFVQENDFDLKLNAAGILSRFHDNRVKSFLLNILKQDKPNIDKFYAALFLLNLNYDSQNIFVELLKDPTLEKSLFSHELYLQENEISKRILQNLMKQDEEIKRKVEFMVQDADYLEEIERQRTLRKISPTWEQ